MSGVILFNTKQLPINTNLLFIRLLNSASQTSERHKVDYHLNGGRPDASVRAAPWVSRRLTGAKGILFS